MNDEKEQEIKALKQIYYGIMVITIFAIIAVFFYQSSSLSAIIGSGIVGMLMTRHLIEEIKES